LYLFVHLGRARFVLSKNTTRCPHPGLELGLLYPNSSVLTTRPLYLDMQVAYLTERPSVSCWIVDIIDRLSFLNILVFIGSQPLSRITVNTGV